MKKCYFLIGVPGSGKSTWIKENAHITEGFKLISTDDIIEAHASSIDSTYNAVYKEYFGTAESVMNSMVEEYVQHGMDIVWDQTNTTKKSRASKIAKLKDYEIIAFYFETPENIKGRLAKRELETGKYIPPYVVDNMIANIEQPSMEEGFAHVQHVFPDNSDVLDIEQAKETMNTKNKVIIVDVDGTLADIEHRRHFVTAKPKNWGAFFKAQKNDKPHTDIVYLVNLLKNDGNTIIIASGRTDDSKDQTTQWLHDHGIQFDHIFMRRAGDYRSDDIVKFEILQVIIDQFGFPYMAIDDRNQVVDMWRTNGVRCLQVAPGDF